MTGLMITPKMLRDGGACEEQYDIYVKEWPEGGEVTRVSLNRALDLGLDIDWSARRFLKGKQLECFKTACASYRQEREKTRDLALNTFNQDRLEAFLSALEVDE